MTNDDTRFSCSIKNIPLEEDYFLDLDPGEFTKYNPEFLTQLAFDDFGQFLSGYYVEGKSLTELERHDYNVPKKYLREMK